MELRGKRVALHRESGSGRDIVFPGQGLRAFKELVKTACVKAADNKKNALCHTQADICSGYVGFRAGEEDFAVLDRDVLHIKTPQFVAHKSLKSEQARGT